MSSKKEEKKRGSFNLLSAIDDVLSKPYEPPKIHDNFPVEIGIELYNLDTSNKEAVKEIMNKYEFSNTNKYPKLLTTHEFISTLENKIKPMIDRAIAGDMPKGEDLRTLNYYLIEHNKLVKFQLNKINYPDLPEDKIDRWIIAEDVDIEPEMSPFWEVYKWIYYVWNLAITVKRCAADDCQKIFIPVRSDQQYHEKRCAKRVWAQKTLKYSIKS